MFYGPLEELQIDQPVEAEDDDDDDKSDLS